MVMTIPLSLLAIGAIGLGFIGTPAWPWFQGYLTGQRVSFDFARLFHGQALVIMSVATLVVAAGISLAWWLYGRKPILGEATKDPLEELQPEVFGWLREKFFVDEIYERTVVHWNWASAAFSDRFDRLVVGSLVGAVSYFAVGFAWLNRMIDEQIVNRGFDRTCHELRGTGRLLSRLQSGQVQSYLRVIGLALAGMLVLLIWGCRA
jgi:NADH-quinone oxidoreductase subunit L